jgi:hypothetical protein
MESKPNRRNFLITTGAGLAGLALVSILPSGRKQEIPPQSMSLEAWMLSTGEHKLDAGLWETLALQMQARQT